jgi:hypothetical protein
MHYICPQTNLPSNNLKKKKKKVLKYALTSREMGSMPSPRGACSH